MRLSLRGEYESYETTRGDLTCVASEHLKCTLRLIIVSNAIHLRYDRRAAMKYSSHQCRHLDDCYCSQKALHGNE
ncbi:hypothetical protein Q1695_009719 [Nippostrongylus brasiliensis]|nr:hypothetical protein Q1695_009719 [Nippostrongylus brasiliensis]